MKSLDQMCLIESAKYTETFATMLTLGCNTDARTPIITTGDIYIDGFIINEENNDVKFLIRKRQSETLYDIVTHMESDLIDLIKTMDITQLSKLPDKCQKLISDNSLSNKQLIHSNYSSKLDMILLGGSLDSVQFSDFNGNSIDYHSLTYGTYKFVINAEKAYLGPHNKDSQIAHLRLQLTKVFFQSWLNDN